MSLLTIENVTAGYGPKNIIENLSFSVEEGELVGILGTNGCGKTTLLKAICNILPHSGECRIDEEALERLAPKQLARRLSYIPQQSGIGIDISALDVVLMGFYSRLGLLQYPDDDMRRQARNTLEQLGLGALAEHNYMKLSEGQKQLCILARAMVSESRVLLMDEPESALDFGIRYRVFFNLKKWLADSNRGALVTLHDINLALNLCDRLLLFYKKSEIVEIRPKQEDIRSVEDKMSKVLGPVSIHECLNRVGERQLMMISEPEGL